MRLFQRAADKQITSQQFFAELPDHWSWELGNRLQGRGWDRLGKQADFQELARSFVAIVETTQA